MTAHPKHLSRKHQDMIFRESGVDPGVAAERGYETVTRRSELQEFGKKQRRASADAPALRVPLHSPDGITRLSQIRPHTPRVSGLKYETPAGAELIIDVHPRMRDRVRHGDEPLLITEGAKTGDAATSRDIPTVVLAGVWGWCVPKVRPYRLRPCWDHVNLEGREVTICFDSDCMAKVNVQQALEALVRCLEERGAVVQVIYLPDAPDGSKQGIDDYLVAGGTIKEMFMLARKFEPSDIGKMRMSHDDKLRAGVADLERRFWSEEWKGMGGHSDRDVALKLIENAKRVGTVVAGGVRVVKAQGPLALEAKVSGRTLWKSLKRLEERGFCYRDNEGRKGDKSGAFVLRADVSHYGEKQGREGNATQGTQAYDRGDLHLRAPRLLWSKPKFTPKRGTVTGTRKVRQGPKPEARDGVARLGKIRGAILDVLDARGGTATLQEIADTLHRKRPRDIRRRNLPWLEDAGILVVEDGRVSLTDNWLDALDDQRRLGGEIDVVQFDGRVEEGAETRARRRYRDRQRKFSEDIRYFKAVCDQDGRAFTWADFWSWRATHGVTQHWTNNPDADGAVEDLKPAGGDLSPEDTRVLEAIEAFEGKYGRGAFKWNNFGAKELFYTFGEWPMPDQLRRISEHLEDRALDALEVLDRKGAA